MKVGKTKANCAFIEIEREHTHTTFYSDTKKTNKPFKEVHITYSIFPQGIRVDTYDDGSIYIEIPRNIDIKIRLNTQDSEPKEAED